MKKLVSLTSVLLYFLSAQAALAQNITIQRPNVGYANISDFLNAVMRMAFIVALIAVLVFIIWGAFDWITSGGEKEAVGKARNKIVNALIGLAVLAVAFALVNLAGTFVGINLLGTLIIPSPSNPTPTLPQ